MSAASLGRAGWARCVIGFAAIAVGTVAAAQVPPKVPEGFTIDRAVPDGVLKFPMFACFDDAGRLFVTESSGLDLYKETFTHFLGAFEKQLGPGCPALFIMIDYGANDNFLQVLALENGHVVQLIHDPETGGEVQYSGEIAVYGPSKGTAREILVSHEDGATFVYRSDKGRYRFAKWLDADEAAEYTSKLVRY